MSRMYKCARCGTYYTEGEYEQGIVGHPPTECVKELQERKEHYRTVLSEVEEQLASALAYLDRQTVKEAHNAPQT